MKKLKWSLLFIMILLAVVFLFATCKKTKALTSAFNAFELEISARDQDNYNAVFIFDMGNETNSYYNFMFINNGQNNYIFLNMIENNSLRILESGVGTVESISLSSRLFEIDIVEDLNGLYMLVYEINYTVQTNQGTEPAIDGISRTMKTRFDIGSFGGILNRWETDNLKLAITNSTTANVPFLVNCSYISSTETPQDVSSWVGFQLSNYTTYNKLIHSGYLAGNHDGYLDGFSDGEERGYSDGYDDGETAGRNDGYVTGRTEGLAEGERIGYSEGYNIGYTDGQAGNTAITPVFNTLSGVFSVVGSVLAIELVPHIPLGIFILVPLFFAAIGLILWIWRRN